MRTLWLRLNGRSRFGVLFVHRQAWIVFTLIGGRTIESFIGLLTPDKVFRLREACLAMLFAMDCLDLWLPLAISIPFMSTWFFSIPQVLLHTFHGVSIQHMFYFVRDFFGF